MREPREKNMCCRLLEEREKEIQRLLERIQGLEEALRLLEDQSAVTTDRLTGLQHNAYFLELIDREFSEARRYARPLSLLIIDLDGFREINDNYGFAVGNKVIENVAKSLKGCCRDSDLISRYGGEEFAVALTQTDLSGARYAADRIRRAIAELSIAGEEGDPIRQVTVSVGFSSLRPDDLTTFALLDRAHRALRRAKEAGRNRSGGSEEIHPDRIEAP
ncbi:MAG TPA: GGDEF domain-containing protein [Chroococcales cyanobacterium]